MNGNEQNIPLIIGPAFMVLLWIAVCYLIARTGGWHRLAERFRTMDKVRGKTFSFTSGRFGIANYNGVLFITLTERGLQLSVFPLFRPFHPRILIPWDAIRNVREKRVMLMRYAVMEIHYPDHIATISIARQVLDSPLWKAEA